MKYISIGDIVGKQGIDITLKYLPEIKKKYDADFVIANIENIAGGKGVDRKSFNEIDKENLIDCYVLGNHTWDNPDIIHIISNKKIVRPLNYINNLSR